MSVLIASQVVKTYQEAGKSRLILDNVDFSMNVGEMHCIVGPSGSGKTTFLNCLVGLDDIDSGRVTFLEKNIHTLPDREIDAFRSLNVGFVYQSHHLLMDLSVIENIMLASVIAGRTVVNSKKLALDLLERFNLTHVKNSITHLLSGGERQRVAVARALINCPKLVVMDEPTGNLDAKNAKIIIDCLYDYINREKSCCLVATHDLNIIKEGAITHELKESKLLSGIWNG